MRPGCSWHCSAPDGRTCGPPNEEIQSNEFNGSDDRVPGSVTTCMRVGYAVCRVHRTVNFQPDAPIRSSSSTIAHAAAVSSGVGRLRQNAIMSMFCPKIPRRDRMREKSKTEWHNVPSMSKITPCTARGNNWDMRCMLQRKVRHERSPRARNAKQSIHAEGPGASIVCAHPEPPPPCRCTPLERAFPTRSMALRLVMSCRS